VVVPRADAVLADGRRLQLSFGTSLAVDDSLASATGLAHEQPVRVRVPGTADGGPERGAALAADLRPGDVRLLSAEPHPAPAAQVVLGSAGMFLGLRYLWGGNSAWGLDCSGLVHLTYRAHGVVVPRDAFDQADLLPGVDLGAVEPGDLYFFARPGEKVYHVGFVSRPVAADGLQDVLEVPPLELVECRQIPEHLVFQDARLAGQRFRQILDGDAPAREDHEALDRVLELTHVARPPVLGQRRERIRLDCRLTPGPARRVVQELLDEERDVLAPLPQRR
jgi:hypothetical protein